MNCLTTPRLLLAMAPLTLLTACGGDTPDDARAPSGEVLEGTISDSMLPLDTVRSQPPLAEPSAAAKAPADEAATDGPESEATAETGANGPAPSGDATPTAAVD